MPVHGKAEALSPDGVGSARVGGHLGATVLAFAARPAREPFIAIAISAAPSDVGRGDGARPAWGVGLSGSGYVPA